MPNLDFCCLLGLAALHNDDVAAAASLVLRRPDCSCIVYVYREVIRNSCCISRAKKMKEAMQNRMKRALAAALAFITLLLPCFAWIPQYPAIFHATRPPTTNTKLDAYLDDDSSSPALPSVTNRNGRQQHEQSSTPEDYTGAGTLGDIMSKETTNNTISGLVTTDGGLLHERFGISSPLDRMALTGACSMWSLLRRHECRSDLHSFLSRSFMLQPTATCNDSFRLTMMLPSMSWSIPVNWWRTTTRLGTA